MKKEHVGLVFDVMIRPDNEVRLICATTGETICFPSPEKFYCDSGTMFVQDVVDEPQHKFIKMCGHWAYVGPAEQES